ncbi:branched-chain amino acid ABC transporter permease [Streptomyces sp. NPDC001668]|uniref:branched-chain amino acid ABC transporter permease n=1 Tax=unclassified Streptomyces TaxID=2593676 RepID=UPI0033DE8F3A
MNLGIRRLAENRAMGPLGFAAAALAPFLIATPYSLNVMTSAAIFVMLAVGLNIVVGYCGLLDLGFVAFFAVGAYTSGVLATKYGLSLVQTIPVVVVVTLLAGVLIGLPTLRLRSDYLAIVTLGFGEIIRILANNLDITGGPSGIYGIPGLTLFGTGLDQPVELYYTVLVLVAAAVVLAGRLDRSRLGRAWSFIREDEDAAEAMGLHTYRVKLAAYSAGAVWGGLAGVLFAAQLSAVSPESFRFIQSALVLMAVVLGGRGSSRGVVVGAVCISLVPELLRGVEDNRYFAFGVVLIAVMIFRPMGLWPRPSREPARTARRSEPEPASARTEKAA